MKNQKTLASLNITSRAVQEYTKAILYDTVILISDEECQDFLAPVLSDGWKYTRQVKPPILSSSLTDQPLFSRFLHVSEKTITDGLQALANEALESDPDFPDLDNSNAFPKILFPRLIASMVRKEKVNNEYDVAVTVYAPIAPDSLLEMCSISEDFRSTAILGSVYRDYLSGEDDEEDGSYVPADEDPEVISDHRSGASIRGNGAVLDLEFG